MTISFLSALFLIVLAISLSWVSRIWLERRSTSIQLLMVASTDFFENAEKLMKTPDELPESVLVALQTMISTMNDNGARLFLRALRRANRNSEFEAKQPGQLAKDVSEMRPELKKLFMSANISWLNYSMYRHEIYKYFIFNELGKMAVRQNRVEVDRGQTVVNVLPNISRAVSC